MPLKTVSQEGHHLIKATVQFWSQNTAEYYDFESQANSNSNMLR